MKVSVSVLSTYDRLIKSVYEVNNTSADFLHIDVMDGKFVEDKKFPIEVLKDVMLINKKPLDVHLMVSDEKTVKEYAGLKPDYLTFHVEIINNYRLIDYVKKLGIKVGLAINPNTDIEKLIPFIDDIDLILFMSVTPGKGGQLFNDTVLQNIRRIKEVASKEVIISIDGGINDKTVLLCKDAGCDMVVSGSYITNSNNYEEQINKLR